MLATRAFHVGSALHLPDASWAAFFIAGYYLRCASSGVLLLEAVAIDVVYLLNGGNPDCFSGAYGFLFATYLALWMGGAWAARAQGSHLARLQRVTLAWFAAAGVAYLISNGSFYWIADVVTHRSLEGWARNAAQWAFGFIVQPLVYVGLAALVHGLIAPFKARALAAS